MATEEKSALAAGAAKLGAIFFALGREFSRIGKILAQRTSNVVVHGKVSVMHTEDSVVYGQEFSKHGTIRPKLGKDRVVPGKNLVMRGQCAVVHTGEFPRVVADFSRDDGVSGVDDPGAQMLGRMANKIAFFFRVRCSAG